MSRFNPFHTLARIVAPQAPSTKSRARWFRRAALLVVMLAAVPMAAQEVVVTINSNSCWNACSLAASRTYNDWIDNNRSEEDAPAAAETHFNSCMYFCEGPF